MRYFLSFLFALLLFSCKQKEEKPKSEIQGLYKAGDTITFGSASVGKAIEGNTPIILKTTRPNGDTFVATITPVKRTFEYWENQIDTLTRKYSGGPVINPPKDTTTPPPPSTGTRNNIIFSALFNGSNPFDPNQLYKQACCSYSVTQAKDIVREGDGSFRAESRASDPSVSEGYRPEFIPTKNTILTDGWYGYSLYTPGWNPCSGFNCGEHIMQWHPASGTGSASLAIWTASGTFNIKLNKTGGTSSSDAVSIKDGMVFKPNTWYDFVWHVVWSADRAKGRIEVWINGTKYCDYTGATLTSGGTPYFKLGINRWNMGTVNRILYVDAVRVGNSSATYKDVAP
jgi:hypothetical protein